MSSSDASTTPDQAPSASTLAPTGGAGRVLDRRGALRLAGTGLVTGALAACGSSKSGGAGSSKIAASRNDATKVSSMAGMAMLEAGNARFAAGTVTYPDQTTTRRMALGAGQHPFAAVLSCADSRVPPELVFDQGLGDLFVVRSAGQVIDRAVLGTLQFGVAELGTPLLVVLGHTKCGAVKATAEALSKKSSVTGTDLDALVAAITPAVRTAESSGASTDTLLATAVANNVANVVAKLSSAKVLAPALKSRRLKLVGAVYDVSTGKVTFT